VYISTDQLFQGDQKFMKEDDLASPVNIYGKSKSKAEKRVLELNSGALVVRTNFYGWGMSYRRSFSDMIIDKLRCNESVVLFKDVYFTPILIDTLVSAVHCLLELKLSGVFNVGGNDRVSKYDFGIMIAKMFSLKANLIVPGYLSMRNDLVQRPFDMSLSNQKLNNLLPGCTNCLEDDLRILRQSEIK